MIDLAPTDSLVRYLQGLGRGLRTHPGKRDLVYLDCVGNRARHGDPAAARLWTLEGADKGSGRLESEVPTKTCPACFATVHAAAIACHCGHVFVPGAGRVVAQVDGELREVSGQPAEPVAPRQDQGRAKTLEDLVDLGRRRGHKRPELWARHVYHARLAKEARRQA